MIITAWIIIDTGSGYTATHHDVLDAAEECDQHTATVSGSYHILRDVLPAVGDFDSSDSDSFDDYMARMEEKVSEEDTSPRRIRNTVDICLIVVARNKETRTAGRRIVPFSHLCSTHFSTIPTWNALTTFCLFECK